MILRGWKGRLAHVLAILGMALALAPSDALAQPAAYTTHCDSCHTNPHVPYPAQLNAAGAAAIIQNALDANMTGLGAGQPVLTTAEKNAIASYITGELTAAPVFNIAFQGSANITLHEITVPSPYGALNGLATVSAPTLGRGTVTGYLTAPARAQFTAAACAVGNTTFTWQATGPDGPSSTRSQTVAIANPSSPPTFSSGAAPSGQSGVSYSHDVNVTACESLVTYSHTAGTMPPGLSLNTSTGVISGTPTTVGNFTGIGITATFTGGQNATQNLSINVTLGPPAFSSGGGPSNVSVGIATANAYTAVASNGPNTYSISGQPPGLTIHPTTGVVSGTPTDASGSPYTATVSATNATTTTNRSVTFNVVPAINSAATANGQTGVLFTYSITESAGPVYTAHTALDTLPAGLTLTSATGVISGTPSATGTTNVRLTGSNAFGTSAQFTLQIVITLGPPVITSAGTATGGEGIAFTPYQITATNSPHSAFNATGLPPGLSVSPSGLITGTPAAASSGVYPVDISATNATGTGNATLTITISSQAPVTTSLTPPGGQTGVAYSYQMTANFAPTSFNATGLPTGLSIDTATGLISGTPTAVGTFNATLTSTNGSGSDNDVVPFVIGLGPPVITSPGTAGGAVGFPFTYQITATNPTHVFAATAIPPGLTLDVNTGIISGTPTTNGVYSGTMSATNSNTTDTDPLVITIAVGVPGVTSATLSGATGTAFNYQVLATNGATSYAATGLPSGLAINTTTGRITGTPTASGAFTVNVSATNATGTGTGVLTLNIALSGPVVTSPPTSTVLPGQSFYYQVASSNCPCTFTATGLPGGLAFDTSSGAVNGTITATGGVYDVVFTVTNATGTTTFTLRITVGFVLARVADHVVEVPFEETTPITLPVTGEVFTVNIVSLPNHGLVTTQSGSGVVIYTPALGYSGPDSFTYSVTNPAGTSTVATVNITVGNLIPVAGPGAVVVPLNTPTVIDMAKFVRGSALTGVAITAQPGRGTATVNGLTITYTPRTNYFGPDSFSYVAFGNAGQSAPAVVTVEVTGRPDPTADRDVVGIVEAQSQAARRFAGAQIGNYQRRMESMHRSAPSNPAPAAQAAPAPARAAAAPVPAAAAPENATLRSESGFVPVSMVQTIMQAVTSRSVDVATVVPAGNGGSHATRESSLWVAGSATFGDRDANGQASGLRFGTDGISAGFDRRFSDRVLAGVGVGYARDETDVGSSSTSKASGGSVAAYASYQPSPRTFIDMLVGYGQIRFDSHRFVEPVAEYADARRKGDQLFGSVAFGYEHRTRNLLVSPYGRFDFSIDRLDAVTESGAGSYALTYGEQTQRSSQVAIGVRAESKHETEFGFAVPRVRAEYRRELQGSASQSLWYADFLGGPEYTITPAGISRSSMLLGVGADLVFRGGLRLGIDYNAQRASGTSNVQSIRFLLTQELDAAPMPAWRWEPTLSKFPITVDGGFAWDDNVSRSRESGEKLSDNVFSLSASITRPFWLGTNTRLVATGLVSGEKFERYAGLGRFSAGAQGELQYRTSGAFDAITFGFVGRALYEQYESNLRTGPRYFVGANARRSLTDRIDLFAEIGANVRDGRSDVFSWRDYAAKLNLDYSMNRWGVFYLTGEYRRGDTVSSGRPSLVNVGVAEVFAPDDAFDGYVAYRFDATTMIGTVGWNYPLGARDSIDFSFRRIEAKPREKPAFDFSGSLRYIDNQYAIVYLMRF